MENQTDKDRGSSKSHKPRKIELGHRGGTIADRVEDEIVQMVENADLNQITHWIVRNPKLAVGSALFAGVLIGAFANGRLGRTAIIGLAGLVSRRFV
jgi:hypothetical protein